MSVWLGQPWEKDDSDLKFYNGPEVGSWVRIASFNTPFNSEFDAFEQGGSLYVISADGECFSADNLLKPGKNASAQRTVLHDDKSGLIPGDNAAFQEKIHGAPDHTFKKMTEIGEVKHVIVDQDTKRLLFVRQDDIIDTDLRKTPLTEDHPTSTTASAPAHVQNLIKEIPAILKARGEE